MNDTVIALKRRHRWPASIIIASTPPLFHSLRWGNGRPQHPGIMAMPGQWQDSEVGFEGWWWQ